MCRSSHPWKGDHPGLRAFWTSLPLLGLKHDPETGSPFLWLKHSKWWKTASHQDWIWLNMTEYDWMFLQLETSSWESDSTDHSAPQFPWVHRTNATSPCCADSLFAKHRTVETIDHSDHSTPRFLQTEDVLHEAFGPAFPHWNVTMSPLSSNSFSVQFLRTCPLLLEDLVGWESHAGHAIQNSWNAEWFQTGFNRFGLSNSPTNMPHSRRKWSAARQKEETQTWTSAKERCWKFSLLRLFQFEQIITKNLHALMSSTQSHNCSK